MKKLVLLLLMLPLFVNAQTIIITKSNDTIKCINCEIGYPKTKYWIEGSDKPIKIASSDVIATVKVPDYSFLTNKVDEFNGASIKILNKINIGIEKVEGNYMATGLFAFFTKVVKESTVVYGIKLFSKKELGCSGANENYTIIKFEDGNIIKLEKDLSEIDCGDHPISTYILSGDNLMKLKKYKISAIRFKQSESQEDYYTLFPDCIIKSIDKLDE